MHENKINIQHVEIAWLQMYSWEIRIAADWKSKLKRLSHLSLCSLAIISVECCNWGIRSNAQDDLGNHNIEMFSAKENCGVNIEGSCGNHIVVNAWQMIVRQIVILMPKLFYLFFLYHGTILPILHIPWNFSDSSINQVTRDECWSTICNINRFFFSRHRDWMIYWPCPPFPFWPQFSATYMGKCLVTLHILVFIPSPSFSHFYYESNNQAALQQAYIPIATLASSYLRYSLGSSIFLQFKPN